MRVRQLQLVMLLLVLAGVLISLSAPNYLLAAPLTLPSGVVVARVFPPFSYLAVKTARYRAAAHRCQASL